MSDLQSTNGISVARLARVCGMKEEVKCLDTLESKMREG